MNETISHRTHQVTEIFTPAEIRAALTPKPTRIPSSRRAWIVSRDRQIEIAAYAELGWTTPTRTLAGLLLALSNGQGHLEIEISDHELAERYAKGRRDIDPESAERQIRRMRTALHADQAANGLYLIGVREGTEIYGPDGVRRTQSKYHVGRLLDLLATLTINPPRTLSPDRRRRAEAWQRAAADLIDHLSDDEGWEFPPIARRKKKTLSVEERIARAIANAAGHACGIWDLTAGLTTDERLDSLTSEIRHAIKERVSVRPLYLEEGEDTGARPTEPEGAPRCGPSVSRQADIETGLPLDFGDDSELDCPDKLSAFSVSQIPENAEVVDSQNAQNAQICRSGCPLEPESDNVIRGSNESPSGASPEEPQEVRASVVPNETPDSAVDEANEDRVRMAREGLEAFRSVGQRSVGLRIGEKDDTREWKVLPIEEAIRTVGKWIEQSDREEVSLAVRPTAAAKFQTEMTPDEIAADDAAVCVRIIEPDLDKEHALETYQRIHHLLCYGSATSRGHYQGAIAVLCDKATFLKLRRRLIAGIDSDAGASGSFRLPGSKNHKPGRRGNVIELLDVAHGRIWTPEELEASGLLAHPEPEPPAPMSREHSGPEQWPSYAIAVDRAPLKQDGSPDLSSADFSFANIARARGFAAPEIEARLIEERSAYDQKATKNRGYVRRTVAKAFGGV